MGILQLTRREIWDPVRQKNLLMQQQSLCTCVCPHLSSFFPLLPVARSIYANDVEGLVLPSCGEM